MRRGRARWPLVIVVAALVVVTAAVAADYWSAKPAEYQATFVGREACVDCHQEEAKLYQDSHHDLAMDLATDETVLADFGDVTFTQYGVTSRFYRDGDKFMVNTEGETGEMEDFEVKYVFGYTPLQNYMVEFDRPDDMPEDQVARVQVLRLTWDTEKGEWFYLSPPDVFEKMEPDDPLHWTGIGQRWQIMCAECHSTNLQENYDLKTNQYHTTFSEIDVSCESCHGPGSLHVELANSRSLFWDRNHGYGLAKLKGDNPRPQIETCAPCHSRRALLDETFQPGDPYHDHFQLETLTEATYHADGQIKDEVYVYGSFIQSKMYHEKIRCTDCHDPHSLQLKFPGNQVCTNCHQHAAGKYDVPSHHHHEPGTEGAMCVNCHMPDATYMAVDPRRDHSMRVPRPDLSLAIGTPNACSDCHVMDQLEDVRKQISEKDRKTIEKMYPLEEYANWLLAAQAGIEPVADAVRKTDQWCEDACEKWYGEDRQTPKHWGEDIAAFRRGDPDGVKRLIKVAKTRGGYPYPPIARATALRELTLRPVGDSELRKIVDAAKEILADTTDEPIVRAAAASVMQVAPPTVARKSLVPALQDTSPLVRDEATRTLAQSDAYGTLTSSERTQVDLALKNVKQTLMIGGDRGGAHMTWGILNERTGKLEEAAKAYQNALRIQPAMTGPRTNLASLLERMASQQPGPTAAQYQQYAAKLRDEELPLLIRDANLAPENADVQHRCGLALYLAGRYDEALQRLELAARLAPEVDQYQMVVELMKQKMAEEEASK
ncbi:tetratricopeptide repeat protein [Crateriforma conspicua]|uniref:Cytochrome c subunit n=1 Tax=Crateriforma conspicua TaxID=2527996 RepID=A0A5C6FSH1_9PLAN|nr:multiheme c-type cytochrome [Crateriforma conspicua]TWU63101.1 cytochrome c subunit [Crateriforma conspicua]